MTREQFADWLLSAELEFREAQAAVTRDELGARERYAKAWAELARADIAAEQVLTWVEERSAVG